MLRQRSVTVLVPVMFRRLLALGLVAGFLATPIGIAHIGIEGVDPCDHSAAPGHGSLRVVQGTSDVSAQHCLTCHWFQSLRGSDVPSLAVVAEATTVSVIEPGLLEGISRRAISSITTRAPPL